MTPTCSWSFERAIHLDPHLCTLWDQSDCALLHDIVSVVLLWSQYHSEWSSYTPLSLFCSLSCRKLVFQSFIYLLASSLLPWTDPIQSLEEGRSCNFKAIFSQEACLCRNAGCLKLQIDLDLLLAVVLSHLSCRSEVDQWTKLILAYSKHQRRRGFILIKG